MVFHIRRTLILIFSLTVCALAADVTGKWTAEFSTPVGGAQKYTFEFKVEGEKLTGKAHFERLGEKGEADLLEGKIAGDEISFIENLEAGGNTLRITYKGKIVGDEIKFARQVGDFSTVEFTAKRIKATKADK
ncbi:MAG TPA: hypothetical protein VJ810_12595 [Blastocatellia bacterium]|nr:hypothetical protein [Blastocatellia bacterium]